MVASLTAMALCAGSASALPHGRAGDCFEEVRGRPIYKTVVETVPQSPLVTWRRTAAVYRSETRTVVVRSAHTVFETIPAVYRTLPQTRFAPGQMRQVVVAAVYRQVQERRLVEPAHLEWRRSVPHRGYADDGQAGLSAAPTGEVLCRILVPARYSNDRREVMVSPKSVRTLRSRPRKVICYVKVLVSPCRRVPHLVPATTRTVVVNRLVKPASCEKILTPRPARTIRRQVRVAQRPAGWRKLACGQAHGASAQTSAGLSLPQARPQAPTPMVPGPQTSGVAPQLPRAAPSSPTRP